MRLNPSLEDMSAMETGDTTICILGHDDCAGRVAGNLLAAGAKVILAAREDSLALPPSGTRSSAGDSIELLTGTRLSACSGGPGRYQLVFSRNGRTLRRTAAAVVIAEASRQIPRHSLYRLTSTDRVLSLSRFDGNGSVPPAGGLPSSQAVFLNGLARENTAWMAGRMMAAALRHRKDTGTRCWYLTGNLKVSGAGLEALAREARAAGVLFFKFTHSTPEIRQGADGMVQLDFLDELTGEGLRLAPDLVVVDEDVRPSAYAVELGRMFELESDAAGFLQADNVHRLPVSTNRRGVVVAGPARDAGLDPAAEAAGAVLELLAAAGRSEAAVRSAAIDPGQCIRCLTCYRVCPYRAVALNTRPTVQTEACERCGICAVECPREAIRIPGLQLEDVVTLIRSGRPKTPSAAPYIVAFCCRRSAGPAARAALVEAPAWKATVNLIEVPCAGSLSKELLLSALGEGADGVLVLACHEDNCHSRHGNVLARSRSQLASDFLRESGAGDRRLMFGTLAANMPRELEAIVSGFIRTLAS
jgi:coenzyme F420-reducing hydrogenase delta subunit/Pyruvate/2-oxoacid:ferredoxin oxidoreductase delta subunit